MDRPVNEKDDLLYPQDNDASVLLPEDLSAEDYLDFISNDMADNEKISTQEYFDNFLDNK